MASDAPGYLANYLYDILGTERAEVSGALSSLRFYRTIEDFARDDDPEDDDTALVNRALNAMQTGVLRAKVGRTYRITKLLLGDKEDFTFELWGSEFVGISEVLNPSDYKGLTGFGSLKNVRILGLNFQGDGVVSHKHCGWWTPSGVVIDGLEIAYGTISDAVLGISSNTNSSGSQRRVHIHDNSLYRMVGTESGQGYALHWADGSGQDCQFVANDNYIEDAERHAVYLARGQGARVFGNVIRKHRSAVARGTILPAINIARVSKVVVEGNHGYEIYDGFINVIKASVIADEIMVRDNFCYSIGNAVPPYVVGALDPTDNDPDTGLPVGSPRRVWVLRNYAKISGFNVEAFRFYNAEFLEANDNTFEIDGVTQAASGMSLQARGETAGTATYSKEWYVRRNRGSVSSSNSSLTRILRVETPMCQSSVGVTIDSNGGTFTDVLMFEQTLITNSNIRIINQGIGLSSIRGQNPGGPLTAMRVENLSATALTSVAVDFNTVPESGFVGGRLRVYTPDGAKRHRLSLDLNNSTTGQSLVEMMRTVPGAGTRFSASNVGSSPVSDLESAGSFGVNIGTVSASGTISNNAHTLLVDASAGALTLTLPAAATSIYREYCFKRKDGSANAVTIRGNGTELIDDANTKTPISSQFSKITVQSDGTQWWIIG